MTLNMRWITKKMPSCLITQPLEYWIRIWLNI